MVNGSILKKSMGAKNVNKLQIYYTENKYIEEKLKNKMNKE